MGEQLRVTILLRSDKFESSCVYAREKLNLLTRTKISFTENKLVDIIIHDIGDDTMRFGALNSKVDTPNELITLLSLYVKCNIKRPHHGKPFNKKLKVDTRSCFKMP